VTPLVRIYSPTLAADYSDVIDLRLSVMKLDDTYSSMFAETIVVIFHSRLPTVALSTELGDVSSR
jgi:hypothetical protein